MSRTPRYLDYVREAFNASPRVPALGHLPLNWLGIAAFATLGILNPGFWLIGAGIEVAFLATLSNNRRFQNYVRGKYLADVSADKRQAELSSDQALLDVISEQDAERYQALTHQITNVPRDGTGVNALVADVAHQGLDTLRQTFLDLLVASSRLRAHADTDLRIRVQTELDQEVRAIEALGERGDPRIVRSRKGTLAILQKRLNNIEKAANDLAFLDSEMRRIEQQVALVIEEASLADDPEALTQRIDQVTATFGETREWMRLHKELLTDFELSATPSRPPPRATESR